MTGCAFALLATPRINGVSVALWITHHRSVPGRFSTSRPSTCHFRGRPRPAFGAGSTVVDRGLSTSVEAARCASGSGVSTGPPPPRGSGSGWPVNGSTRTGAGSSGDNAASMAAALSGAGASGFIRQNEHTMMGAASVPALTHFPSAHRAYRLQAFGSASGSMSGRHSAQTARPPE